jgi:hypothetical protein
MKNQPDLATLTIEDLKKNTKNHPNVKWSLIGNFSNSICSGYLINF